MCNDGLRVLGIAYRENITVNENLEKEAEENMIFVGFIVFFDPLREGVPELIKTLNGLGNTVKNYYRR